MPLQRVLVGIMVVALSLTQTPATQAQLPTPPPLTPDDVDVFIVAEMARMHIPGVSLAVVKAGQVIKTQGYGFADMERRDPVIPETVFRIGSTSKQFIATGIMLLAQDGNLTVDDPVTKYYASAPPSWRAITLRNFLTHTSGVVRESPIWRQGKPDSQVVQSTFALPLRFSAGSAWGYCNVCYFALADVIARVSGTSWDAFITQRVFAAQGMTSTRTVKTEKNLGPRGAQGYVWNEKSGNKARYTVAEPEPAVRPSGAFQSTVLDLAKWDAALYRDDVLSPASRDAMWTAVKLTNGTLTDYGFGWFVWPLNGHRIVEHGGSVNGFRAQITRFLDDSLTVIVLGNSDSAEPAEIAMAVGRAYIPALRPRPWIAVDSVLLERYVGAYETGPGVFTVIHREGGQLFSRLGPQQLLMPIFPESRTAFFATNFAAEIGFSGVDPWGRATSMTLHQNGRDQVAPRNEVASPRLVAAAVAFAKRFKDQTPVAGGAAALRRLIEEIAAGAPNYALMTTAMAATIRQQLERTQAALAPLGRIQSLTFRGVGPGGADIYTVKFEKDVLEWRIWLSPDGKIENANNRPAPPG